VEDVIVENVIVEDVIVENVIVEDVIVEDGSNRDAMSSRFSLARQTGRASEVMCDTNVSRAEYWSFGLGGITEKRCTRVFRF
jgi:hypothetical protein